MTFEELILAGNMYLGYRYKKSRLTIEDVANKFNISSPTLRKYLVNIGVPIRGKGQVSFTNANNANKGGKELENWIKFFCDKYHINYAENIEYEHPVNKYRPKKVRKGKNSNIEFLISLPSNKIFIDCKMQSTSGSAEEKLFYTHWSMSKLPHPGIIVIGGNGWREGFISLVKAELSTPYVQIMVVEEFFSLLNKEFELDL